MNMSGFTRHEKYSLGFIGFTWLAIAAISCGNDPTPIPLSQKNFPGMIQSLGDYSLFRGEIVIHVKNIDDMIQYTIERDKGPQVSIKSAKPRIKQGSNWFIFPVSADEVWIYEGNDSLVLYTKDLPINGNVPSSYILISADATHNILKKAPGEVLDRIPKSMKDKYGVQ